MGVYNWHIQYSTKVFIFSRLVKTVTGKPVIRFPTGYRFSECITGYRIYRTSRWHDPGNAWARIAQLWVQSPAVFSQFGGVGSFWTSVLTTGRLSTSVVHVWCPSTWRVLYFWMEISNWAGLVADFERWR